MSNHAYSPRARRMRGAMTVTSVALACAVLAGCAGQGSQASQASSNQHPAACPPPRR